MAGRLYIQHALKRIADVAAGMSRLAFAKEAGLRESTLRGLGAEDWNPKLDTLLACERAAARIAQRRRAQNGG